MITLKQAINLAKQAHKGQWRKERPITDDEFLEFINMGHGNILKSGVKVTWCKNNKNRVSKDPYITHPLAVINMMSTDEEKIVAVLHDVIEDTEYYLNSADRTICNSNGMNIYLGIDIFLSLCHMTKEKNQSYEAYIIQISCDKLATKVKIADIMHNLSSNPSDSAKEKYLKAIPVLLAAL